VGKKTFARALAQSLLCETPKSTLLGYCNRVRAARSFARARIPTSSRARARSRSAKCGSAQHDEDLTARDLVRELSLHGYRSAYRVVLLGDVDFATHEAANALLKFFRRAAAGVVMLADLERAGHVAADHSLALRRDRLRAAGHVGEVESVLRAGGVDATRARLAAEASFGSITRARAVLEGADEGIRGAAFAWFADAMSGRAPDRSFLQLDDRSLNASEKRAARCGDDRDRAHRRARLGDARRRRRRAVARARSARVALAHSAAPPAAAARAARRDRGNDAASPRPTSRPVSSSIICGCS
jgi:hypothetical protein